MNGDPDKRIRNKVILQTLVVIAVLCGVALSGCFAVAIHERLLSYGESAIVAWAGSIAVIVFALLIATMILIGVISDKEE